MNIGFSLVNLKTGEELQTWVEFPRVITFEGEDRTGAIPGAEFKDGSAIFVERVCEQETPYGNPPVIKEEAKFDGERVVVNRTFADPDLEALRKGLVSRIKMEAGLKILDFCPQYKQANLTARAAELSLTFPTLKGEELPEPYKSEWAAGNAVWAHIKALRAYSNGLEKEALSLQTLEEIKAWRPHDWPVA